MDVLVYGRRRGYVASYRTGRAGLLISGASGSKSTLDKWKLHGRTDARSSKSEDVHPSFLLFFCFTFLSFLSFTFTLCFHITNLHSSSHLCWLSLFGLAQQGVRELKGFLERLHQFPHTQRLSKINAPTPGMRNERQLEPR